MTTKTTKTTSVKQKCFYMVDSCPNGCLLCDYSNGDARVLSSDESILSYLTTVRFGKSFILVSYKDSVRRSICVLVDGRKWLQISEPLFFQLNSLFKKS